MRQNQKAILVLLFISLMFPLIWGIRKYAKIVEEQEINASFDYLKEHISKKFYFEGELPGTIESKTSIFDISYSINGELTEYIKVLVKRYRPDYAGVVVVDNTTGEILSTVGYSRKDKTFNSILPFTSTHPAASLIKIITTAELLENTDIEPESKFRFKGRGTTLYKYQLKDSKKKRWTRTQTLEKAFSYSNNVIFGKAAIKNLTEFNLYKMATKFGFNQRLTPFLDVARSYFEMPTSKYNLAEFASGFNKKTMMSPLHGAMLSSIIANDGIMVPPTIVSKVIKKDDESDRIVWLPEMNSHSKVLSQESSDELMDMMQLTVSRGTARGSFRGFRRSLKKHLDVGGKTGTITGGVPYGRRDWFTSYAKPVKQELGKGISVCVMIINQNKWYVRSAYLAKKIIEYYYTKIKPFE